MKNGGHLAKAMLLLRLAALLHERREGLGLEDIQEIAGCSRRTAERLRDALMYLYTSIEEEWGHDGRKRWKLRAPPDLPMPDITTAEMADLQLAARMAGEMGASHRRESLESLHAKVAQARARRGRLPPEIDIEILLQAEGLASSPRPRERVDPQMVGEIREAILTCNRLEIEYEARISGEVGWRVVEPHGFLMGRRHYLVAREKGAQGPDGFRLFALANIRRWQKLNEPFVMNEDFSIADYAAYSFGVWRDGRQYAVRLEFAPEVAGDAANFHFHRSQRLTRHGDGRIEVEMTCSGLTELCHHLFTWGDAVRIIEPPELKTEMQKLLDSAARALAR